MHHVECSYPCSVFLTMRDEEGFNRALKYKEYLRIDNDNKNRGGLFDPLEPFELEIKEANEPSDIIWENRPITWMERRKREVITGAVLTLVLFLSFMIIFIMS